MTTTTFMTCRMYFLQAIFFLITLLPPMNLTLQNRTFVGPSSLVSSVDSTVELKCRLVGGSPYDRVVWILKGLPLGRADPSRDGLGYSQFPNRPRFKSYENLQSGEFRLKISPLLAEDGGIFQCQALATERSGHVNSAEANLTVQVPPKDVKMKIQTRSNFFETRSEYNLRSNMTFTVRCEVGPSYPPPAVVWKIGQVQLENMRNSVVIRRNDQPAGGKNVLADSQLTFVAEPWMDGKNLTCLASHPALDRPLERAALISVLYIPYVNITLIPDLSLHKEYSSLLAICNVQAKPEHSRIRWYIGGIPVENASTGMLQLAPVTRQHHGKQLMCGAENSIGISYASVDVAVTYGPKFISKGRSEDTWVDQREQVVLTCNDVDSYPPATIRWFRRGIVDYKDMPVGDDPASGNSFVSDVPSGSDDGGDDDDHHGGDGEYVSDEDAILTFRPTDLRSFGVYTCVASNPGFEDVKRKFFVGRKGPPTVLGPKEQTAVLGKIGSITCMVRGIPRPDRIIWYRNGELLDFDKEIRYSSKERDTRYGRLSTVEILDAVETDFTIFNCSAFSSHGFDSQLIILRKRELVPFYCWVATAVATVVLVMIMIVAIVCFKYWKKMPGSVVCCQDNKKLPSSDGSASTSQTSSDSMDLKRICNLPDISIQHPQNKNYGAPFNKQSPTFDTLEQKQKLLQVNDTVEKSYTRFESPNHHMYSYHPNGYPCDSPDCHSTFGIRQNADDFITDRYGTCSSGGAAGYAPHHERDSFLSPYPKTCLQDDCKAFKAYAKLAPSNLYGPTPVTLLRQGNDVEDKEEDYADDIRRSQYNPGLCSPLTLNRQYYQPPPLLHPPRQYSPSSGGSTYPSHGQPPKQPPSTSSYSSPSPTDSKLSTNV